MPTKPVSGNEQARMLNRFSQKISNALIFLTLLVLSISNLYPFFYMFLNSVKSRTDYYINPFSMWGLKLTWENYSTMVSQFKILNLFGNSFYISFFSIVLLLCFGIVASYAFAKLKFKGKNVIYLGVLSTMFIPVQATIDRASGTLRTSTVVRSPISSPSAWRGSGTSLSKRSRA